MPLKSLVPCLLLAGLFAGTTAHAEFCHSLPGNQFANASHVCVSSMLTSQGSNSYGPAMMTDDNAATAWCEGAPDNGHGQWIELRWSEPQRFRTLWLVNGYSKSEAAFNDNGRLALVRIETGDGLVTEYPLYDQSPDQPISLPRPVDTDFIRLTILKVFPGARYSDTCVDEIWADLEELNGY